MSIVTKLYVEERMDNLPAYVEKLCKESVGELRRRLGGAECYICDPKTLSKAQCIYQLVEEYIEDSEIG